VDGARDCPGCGQRIETVFRFCPWCATPQRLKLVELFRAHPRIESDRGKALRVSRYFGGVGEESHVRFSVWNERLEAESAVSVTDEDAVRLARFVLTTPVSRPPARALYNRLVGAARRVCST